MEIGTRIREYRQANGMKQEALAAACKVSRQTVSNWERNKTLPDIASLKAIATAFDTSVDALIGNDAPHIIERFDADSRRFLAIFFLMQVCWVSSSLLRLFAANAPNHEEELSIAVAEAFVLGIWIMSLIPYLRYTRRNGLKTIGDISAHLLEHMQQEKSFGMRLTRSILSHIYVWNWLLCDDAHRPRRSWMAHAPERHHHDCRIKLDRGYRPPCRPLAQSIDRLRSRRSRVVLRRDCLELSLRMSQNNPVPF